METIAIGTLFVPIEGVKKTTQNYDISELISATYRGEHWSKERHSFSIEEGVLKYSGTRYTKGQTFDASFKELVQAEKGDEDYELF